MSKASKSSTASKRAAALVAPAPTAPAIIPPPVARPIVPLTLKGRIARIDVDKTGKAPRFIIVIADGNKYEYFSTPLTSPDSMRITSQQLKAAFPELNAVTSVFVHLLTNRNHFVGRTVEYSVSVQIDRDTKLPKINPKTNLPYTNVRIEPSSESLTEEDAIALLGMAAGGDDDLSLDDLPQN